mgnify:CR=1 FL=1
MEKFIVFFQKIFWFIISKLLYQFRFKKLGWNSYFYGFPSRLIGVNRLTIKKGTIILPGSRIEIFDNFNKIPNVIIHESCMIGHNFFISCFDSIEIKPGCLFSDNVAIIDNTHHHVPGKSSNETFSSSKAVKIERNCTIYRNVTILEGVTIGEGSVVGANSVVKKDVEPFSVVAGIPAKFVKYLTKN